MSPLRAGLFYGGIGALVALVANSYPSYLDPEEMSGRLVAALAYYRPLACLALYALLAALAAFEMRPNAGAAPEVPYRQMLLRDGGVAGAMVAVAVGAMLVVLTFLQATVFAGVMRDYARGAAPKMHDYVNEERLRLEPPSPPREPRGGGGRAGAANAVSGDTFPGHLGVAPDLLAVRGRRRGVPTRPSQSGRLLLWERRSKRLRKDAPVSHPRGHSKGRVAAGLPGH